MQKLDLIIVVMGVFGAVNIFLLFLLGKQTFKIWTKKDSNKKDEILSEDNNNNSFLRLIIICFVPIISITILYFLLTEMGI